MKLPELPKKYKRKEADITPFVMDWFFNNYPADVAIEVKIKGNKTLSHQDASLDQVKDGKFKWKIPDQGKRNPFDFLILKTGMVRSFVVTCEGRACQAVGRDGDIFDFRV